jgi:hypothetical protein
MICGLSKPLTMLARYIMLVSRNRTVLLDERAQK